MILPRAIRLPFVVSVCALLAGCNRMVITEIRAFSPQTEDCTVERYRPTVENHLDKLGPGGKTEYLRTVYSVIASEILLLPPIASGRCEIEYEVEYVNGVRLSYDMFIAETQGRLCIEHRDSSGVNRARADGRTEAADAYMDAWMRAHIAEVVEDGPKLDHEALRKTFGMEDPRFCFGR